MSKLYNDVKYCSYLLNAMFRIIQAFEVITQSLIENENFSDVTVIAEDVVFTGERVSDSKWHL